MGTHIESNFRMAVHKVSRLIFALFILGVFQQHGAYALTINVVGPDGVTAVTDYRWLVEEDATKASVQNVPADASNLALSFHTSYMPVVAAGDSIDPAKSPANLVLDAAKRYYVSVLPRSGYQMGGAQIAPGQTAVTIVVNKAPVPTAQISIFVFGDNYPINGAPDMPQELGLANFSITLKEAGGTYGQSGGQVTKDAFNNPLGTTYQQNVDGSFVYNPDGSPAVLALGNGFIKSGPDGVAVIKYLFPAKYTIEVIPPDASWHQTSTIEGTKGIDAWVKANEPAFFQEFGPAGHHVDVGFVKNFKEATVLNGTATVSGKVVNQHMSRPPNFTFYNGGPVPSCWIGLNELAGVGGRGLYASPCNADSTFSIPNVPAGTFQLVIWDEFLDRIIASTNVTVPPGGANVNLLDVPVFDWFGHYQASVFFDTNQNGFRDPGEMGIPDQAMNLRFRDGSIYQSMATDVNGVAKFNEVFPFFHWLVAEVDFLRYKATGATVVVDNGGPVPPDNGWTMPSLNQLNPQPQFDTDPVTGAATTTPLIGPAGNNLSRTETGPVLLQGIATFLGQTNVIEWGKANYGPGESGGISGIVRYGITRAENDPRYAAAENWEPGIPRVQINLYRDCDNDGKIDQPDPAGAGCLSLSSAGYVASMADVDNYPFGWNDGTAAMGTEDVKRNAAVDALGAPVYSKGDAVDVTWTDSWDDSLPTGCQGPTFVSNGVTTDCYDGLRNFNQVRPAVFDGGYAFGGGAGKPELPPGTYVVEAMAPKGYIHQGNGDQNVAFGDVPAPSPLALPPECVGDPLPIPQYLNLFSDVLEPNPSYDPANPGKTWNQCDRKKVTLNQGMNAPSDFYLFTEVPVAGHIVGMILDDTANEFDPNSPTFGEKYAPSWLPVSIRDWSGREVSRVYADQWGHFNALVPSTYTINPPFPSGVSPNMVTTCMNDPGPIKDTRAGSPSLGQMIIDPNFNRQYSQFCYTFQYLPGKTTYLDTPVIPVAAFAGPGQFPLDCEFDDGVPVIYSVEGKTKGGVSFNGPYVPPPSATDPNIWPRLTIVSSGMVEETNPAYDGTPATTKTIFRDHGFGAVQGTGNVMLNGVSLPIVSWSDGLIIASVPNTASTGQLQVTRGNGKSTVTGVTVTVGGYGTGFNLTNKIRVVTPGTKIQTAIDAANRGDMIMVPPGTYDELIVMNKGVRLQGWGAPATHINAAKVPTEKLVAWRSKVSQLLATGGFDLLPGQTVGPNATPFNTEEGPGILVVAKASGPQAFINTRNARIDGFTISGSDNAGGIFVNGYANYLEISNNKLMSNYGINGGGIRLGHPTLVNPTVTPANDGWYGGYTNAKNNNVRIHHNHVTQNGSNNGAGGGIALNTGSHGYKVTNNYVCGNFSMSNGGGIAHVGLSNNGMIANNTVIFNQTFKQLQNVSGGGILVGGAVSLGPTLLSPGSGNVTVSSNLVQGNQAGAGDGGGIRAQFVNGLDVRRAPGTPASWYQLTLTNNKVVNNMAGAAGGGISLLDTAKAIIDNNTVANNDSTGTAGAAFMPGSPNQSTPQPAGIVSRAHSTLLFNAIGAASGYKLPYSNPVLTDNIVWHNRSFYWAIDNTTVPATFGLVPNIAAGQAVVYSDLAVLGTAAQGIWPGYVDAGADKLNPLHSILTDMTGYDASNSSTAPGFVAEYFNGDQGQTIKQPELATAIATAGAFDEGGNWIDVRFGPLTLYRICLTPGACPLYGDYQQTTYGGIGANP